MDYSRLMMGIGNGGSGGGSVTPTTKKVSNYFAEPNLPQQYIETLGAPFGDRYVYQIFMQGINVLPEIPSSAEGSELVARVKEKNGNQYAITEFYFVKQEGKWIVDGRKDISEWTEETESSGSGGNVLLYLNNGRVFDRYLNPILYKDFDDYVRKRNIVWIIKENRRYPHYYSVSSTRTVVFQNGSDSVVCEASSGDAPLVEKEGETPAE